MLIEQFLKHVLPTDGHLVLFVLPHDGKHIRNYPYDNYRTLANGIETRLNNPENLYIAVGSYRDAQQRSIKRTNQNTYKFKSLVCDIDCGIGKSGKAKPYPNQEAGLTAVYNFCKTIGLPLPTTVNSGYGLHCWWTFDTDIDPKDWYALQSILNIVADHYKLEYDKNITNKMSCVLRPPGTINFRSLEDSKPVKVLNGLQPAIELNWLRNHLNALVKEVDHAPKYFDEKAEKYVPGAGDAKTLNVGHIPAIFTTIEQKCAQVKHAIENQADTPYMQWFNLMGIAKYTTHPEETIIRWSEHHPTYKEGDTLRKLKTWSGGPTLCKTLESFGPKDADNITICKACSFFEHAHLKTPVQIGISREEKIIQPENPDDDPIEMPDGYKCTDEGIFKIIDDGLEQPITPYKIWIKEVVHDKNTAGDKWIICFYTLQDEAGEELVSFSANAEKLSPTNINGADTLFATKGLTLRTTQEVRAVLEFLADFKRQHLERKKQKATVYSTNGWHAKGEDDPDNPPAPKDYSFTLGQQRFFFDEKGRIVEQKFSRAVTGKLGDNFGRAGSVEKWSGLTEVFGNKECYAHAVAFGAGFAAPLYQFHNLGAMIMHMVGDTGTGKTTVQRAIGSLIGPPEANIMRGDSTHHAIIAALATAKNLCVNIDEITQMKNEVASKLIFEISGGQERGRLRADLTEREDRRWSTILTTSGNVSLASKLSIGRNNIRPELKRFMDIQVNPNEFFGDGKKAATLNQALLHNYGHAMRRYIGFILGFRGQYGNDSQSKMADFFEREFKGVNFLGSDRFAKAALESIYMGLYIANHIGLFKPDPRPIIECGLEQFEYNRREADDRHTSILGILSRYLNDNIQSILLTHKSERGPAQIMSPPQRSLTARITVVRKGTQLIKAMLYIDMNTIRKIADKEGIVLSRVYDELDKEGILLNSSHPVQKIVLGEGLGLAGAKTEALCLNAMHDKFPGIKHFFGDSPPTERTHLYEVK